MKITKYTVAIGNQKDMNDLVDLICKILNQDASYIRDKFKMVSNADLKKLIDMCKLFKLKIIFDPTGKTNMVTIEVPASKVVKIKATPVVESKKEEKKEDSPELTEEPQVDSFVSVNTDEEGDPF